MLIVICGSDSEIIDGFDIPFKRSAHYLGMNYLGYIHTWIENKKIPEVLKSEISKLVNNNSEKNR